MGIAVAWDNEEQSIVRFTYTGKWTWDEFYVYIKQANDMMDAVGKPCVSIVDMSATSHLPIGAAVHIRNVIRQSMSHNNSGITVFINADTIVRIMIDALRQNYPDIKDFSNFQYVKTLEEAREKALVEVQKLRGNAEVSNNSAS